MSEGSLGNDLGRFLVLMVQRHCDSSQTCSVAPHTRNFCSFCELVFCKVSAIVPPSLFGDWETQISIHFLNPSSADPRSLSMTGRYLASPGTQLKVTCMLHITPCASADCLPIPHNVCKANRHVLVGRVLVSLGRGPKKSNT